jgi:DNA polymerase-3 subunit alpha
MRWAERSERDACSTQIGLFAGAANGGGLGDPPRLPEIPAWSDKEMLRHEKDAIGFFLTAHPLDKYRRDLARLATVTTATLGSRPDQEKVKLGGVIHTVRLKNSKKGERYATFLLEDKEGVVEVIAWPDGYRKFEALIQSDDPVLVSGTLDKQETAGGDDGMIDARRERCQIIADELRPLAAAREQAVKQVHFRLRAERVTDEHLVQLRDIIAQHRGRCPAYLSVLVSDDREALIELPRDLHVTPSEDMIDAVDRLLGNGMTLLR